MSDWINCNNCATRFNHRIKIFLTECGHLICEICMPALDELICVVCQEPTKVVHISKDMDPSLQHLFVPYEVHFQRALEVLLFQWQHKSRFIEAALRKYNVAKKDCLNCFEKNRQLSRENKVLRNMLMSAGRGGSNQSFQPSRPTVSVRLTPDIQQGTIPASYVAHRLLSGKRNFKPFCFKPHWHSGGSFLHRPSPSQLTRNMEGKPAMPKDQGSAGMACSLEQLRRTARRT